MSRHEVIGICEVAGVKPGNEVELDPAKYHIGPLITAGHIGPELPEVRRASRAKHDTKHVTKHTGKAASKTEPVTEDEGEDTAEGSPDA